MIDVKNLVKHYGNHAVLQGVNFQAADGECMALNGANGAGKTTFLRILAGGLSFNSGTAIINGYDLLDFPLQARRSCGFVGHQTLLYADLTAEENLWFYCGLYDVTNGREILQRLLAFVGLEGSKSSLVRTFSRGMQQRLAIARALLHDPSVLLMDEPMTSLDPEGLNLLQQIVMKLKQGGKTLVMATHDESTIKILADRIVTLEHGLILGKKGGVSN